MSAAFDTIDHDILISRLEKRCGITGTALRWFRSYLSNRTQCVVVGGATSHCKPLKYGVPQGSRLGPILFNLYTSPIGDLFQTLPADEQRYADDEQVLLAFSVKSPETQLKGLHDMTKSINEIREFLKKNKLCNNEDKTEFIITGSQHNLNRVIFDTLQIGEVTVKAVDKARNLGVIFDKNQNMASQVKNICINAQVFG